MVEYLICYLGLKNVVWNYCLFSDRQGIWWRLIWTTNFWQKLFSVISIPTYFNDQGMQLLPAPENIYQVFSTSKVSTHNWVTLPWRKFSSFQKTDFFFSNKESSFFTFASDAKRERCKICITACFSFDNSTYSIEKIHSQSFCIIF